VSTQIFEAVEQLCSSKPVSSIVGLDLGVIEPGSTSRRKVFLCSKSFPGDRTLEYSVRFKFISSSVPEEEYFKKAEEIILPFSTAFSIESWIQPQNGDPFGDVNKEQESTGLLSLTSDFFSAPMQEISIHHELVIVSTIKCLGPWDIVINESRFVNYPEGAQVVAVLPPDQPSSIGKFKSVLKQ
jgi:hypothetical protein